MSEQFKQDITKNTPTPETPSFPQEQFLRESLPFQFNTQTASLRAVGLLESILKENPLEDDDLVIELQEGITGMDGRSYPLPTVEQIASHFSQEKYAEKISQGFTKLLIVPFAYPLATICARYAQALFKHHKEGKLLDRYGFKLDLKTRQPLFIFYILDKSDETGGMIYYPKQFDAENHGGYTKQELLNDSNQPFPGFHILLIKPDLTILRKGSADTEERKMDLETGKTPEEYLQIIQTDPQYCNEQGMTLEDSFILGLTNLHETDKVIDDNENDRDSMVYNIGIFNKDTDSAIGSSWDRPNQQVNVRERYLKTRHKFAGCRTAVA